ncbi:MAG: cyclic pyranopterin monophosphate synthase MoaC [Thermoplasmata archaeon]|nr:cyclic pyranopterin monophosphate synthase MoaC [Thermoplasmata archaeon]MCI4362438.1 cyclic pyranopterin monophosphate synthase MoaC [Thermoplasmata archaeon]
MTQQRRIHTKPLLFRRALVEGSLSVRPATAKAIRAGRVKKGDPFAAGELAGILAMKRTPELIPHCHPVPLTGTRVELRLAGGKVRVLAEAEAVYRTGVEMEALVGATIALLTVWDMVKYLEKDRRGGYPTTRLGPVTVVRKEKHRGAKR